MTGPSRRVGVHLGFAAVGPTEYVLAASVADPGTGLQLREETLEVVADTGHLDTRELSEHDGARLRLFETGAGGVTVDYGAVVAGRAAAASVDTLDAIVYTRPSRYCESDTLTPFARERFGSLTGPPLLAAVTGWVHERLRYDSAQTSPTGGAVETLDRGAGVCRDFAHLVIALLRARDVPARHVSVYAPGLAPMDFHAVVEALIDGRWLVVDATRLAPRRHMLRISTGRDAADTAFLTNTVSDIELTALRVRAELVDAEGVVVDPGSDDPGELVELG